MDMEVRTTEEYVQYKYKDETEWNDLVKIETLASGKNTGREVKIKTENDAILWKYSDASEWIKLVDLKALAGKDGKDGENGTNGSDGKDGEDGVDGIDGRDGVDGVDGKDGVDGIDGEDGVDGIDGEDGVDGIDGEDAQAWINVGNINTSDYCAVRFKDTDDEDEYCGFYSDSEGNNASNIYVEQTFADALAGNYNFTDDDGDEWSIRVERNENIGEDSQSALIEFWYNNGDGKKGYIHATRWSSDDEWEFRTYYYATIDEMKEALNKYDWIDLGVLNTDWNECTTFANTGDDKYCGYIAYIAKTFPDYSEGRYKFHDEDGAQWLVKIEENAPNYSENEEHVLIEIWGDASMTTEYIQGDYYGDGWALYYYTYTPYSTTDSILDNISNLSSSLNNLKKTVNDLSQSQGINYYITFKDDSNIEDSLENHFKTGYVYTKEVNKSASFYASNGSKGYIVETREFNLMINNSVRFIIKYYDMENPDIVRYTLGSLPQGSNRYDTPITWGEWKTENDMSELESNVVELQTKVTNLEATNINLNNKNNELEEKINSLEERIRLLENNN